MSELILQTEELTKNYGKRLAVDRVSLSIGEGDIFGFLGQNGAGKSTLIRMVLGLIRPTRGRALLFGQDIAKQPLKVLAHVGAIVEAPAFYENFSGLENLRMLSAMSGGVTRKRIDEVLTLVDLAHRARDPVRTYSHGMRQRLGIAQALLPNPRFVILDEPTDGLDPQGIREVRILLQRLRDELRLTILLCSHMLDEVDACVTLWRLSTRGVSFYQGPIGRLLADEMLVKATVDRPDVAFRMLMADPRITVSRNGFESLYVKMQSDCIPRINAQLVTNGIRVMELSPQRKTLEDVFLTLTKASASH